VGLLCLSRRGLLESELWELVKMRCASIGVQPRAYRFYQSLAALRTFFHHGPKFSDVGGERSIEIR
jgi:hypothetical protein